VPLPLAARYLGIDGGTAHSRTECRDPGILHELQNDSLAIKRVEVALLSFGPVRVISEFNTAECFFDPQLEAVGDTPMGEAIRKGIELIKNRKEQYRANGISFYRPWIFLITDGAPTDEWQSAAALVREGENAKSFAFFAIGVTRRT
jgi:uncharacterized protein YegL